MFVTVTLAVGGDGTITDVLFADGKLSVFHYLRRVCTCINETHFPVTITDDMKELDFKLWVAYLSRQLK